MFYAPPWLDLRWKRGGGIDQTWPFVIELPLLALPAIWLAIRLLAYPFVGLGPESRPFRFVLDPR